MAPPIAIVNGRRIDLLRTSTRQHREGHHEPANAALEHPARPSWVTCRCPGGGRSFSRRRTSASSAVGRKAAARRSRADLYRYEPGARSFVPGQFAQGRAAAQRRARHAVAQNETLPYKYVTVRGRSLRPRSSTAREIDEVAYATSAEAGETYRSAADDYARPTRVVSITPGELGQRGFRQARSR